MTAIVKKGGKEKINKKGGKRGKREKRLKNNSLSSDVRISQRKFRSHLGNLINKEIHI